MAGEIQLDMRELVGCLIWAEEGRSRFVLDVVGGTGLQLRQRKDRVYIPYDLVIK